MVIPVMHPEQARGANGIVAECSYRRGGEPRCNRHLRASVRLNWHLLERAAGKPDAPGRLPVAQTNLQPFLAPASLPTCLRTCRAVLVASVPSFGAGH